MGVGADLPARQAKRVVRTLHAPPKKDGLRGPGERGRNRPEPVLATPEVEQLGPNFVLYWKETRREGMSGIL